MLIMLLLSISCTFAQDSSLVKLSFSIITGIVTDIKDNSPIEADIILFHSKDTVKISTVKCDTSGKFSLSATTGTYKIEFSAVGYASLMIDNIKILAADTTITLEAVKLKKQDVTTEEVLVEGEKQFMTLEGDKKVFNVDQSMLNKSGTVLDVMRKVPLIDVDLNDNVTLRGSTNVKILIDNKENRYGSLKQIPADAVEKIEVLTNPPAKYEAEGVTGIINIVMKKIDKVGFSGDAFLQAGSQDKYNASLDLNLKKNKVTVYSSGYYGIYHYSNNNNSSTQYYIPLSFLLLNGSSSGKSIYFTGNAGLEYDIKEGHTIGIEGSYTGYNYDGSYLSSTLLSDSLQNLTSSYNESSAYSGNSGSYMASIYYNGKLNKTGRELSGDITFSGNYTPTHSVSSTDYFDAFGEPTIPTHRQIDDRKNHFYNLNVQADYTNPVKDKTKFELGYKGFVRLNDNRYDSDTLDNDVFVFNYSVSNRFKLTDYINALYGTFQSGYKNFTFKLGLRLEQTNTKGELVNTGSVFYKNYLNIFPTISITQDFGQMSHIQFMYSRRITRPNVYRLNPFVIRSDQRYIYFGNPDLNPEFTDSYELSLMFYSKIISVTPMLFLRRSRDIISNYTYITDSVVTVTTYRNAQGSNAYGMDLILNSQSLGWLNLNGTLSFYKTKFDGEAITDYLAEEGFSWKANIRAFLSFGKGFQIEMYYYYMGKKINAQGTNVPYGSLTAGIRQSFLKDKLTFNLTVNDPFKTMQWGSDIDGIGYKSTSRSNYNTRTFYLGVSYTFGNTEEYFQKKKKVKQNQNEQNDQQEQNNK